MGNLIDDYEQVTHDLVKFDRFDSQDQSRIEESAWELLDNPELDEVRRSHIRSLMTESGIVGMATKLTPLDIIKIFTRMLSVAVLAIILSVLLGEVDDE